MWSVYSQNNLTNMAPIIIQESEVLSFEQALAILPGFTKWGLYNMVRRRQIPYRKRGKRILFIRAELTQWVQNLPGVNIEEALRRGDQHV